MKKVLLLALMSTAFAFQSCNQGSGIGSGSSYQEKIMSVAEIEQANPAQFLNASGTYRENFWGDLMKVNGTIENNATVANYKDVIVEVTLYSQTETVLDTKRYVVYDYFPAHSKKTFLLKIPKVDGCKKLGWTAVGATPY